MLVLLMLIATAVGAQNISVASFKLLENDLTANTTGAMKRDLNGEVAALIKVVTTEQGFAFDGGMAGVVGTKQEVGEVWVYVPYGIKKITIKHPQLGVLRDYYFPIAIDKAKTYEMVLTTGKVQTIVEHSINKQFVVFNVKPTDAVVELDGEPLSVDAEGHATKGLPFGTYSYRVSCVNYHTEAGMVTVTAENKSVVDVTLRPNFGWLKLTSNNEYHGAHVYVDNVRVGQLPYMSKELKSGIYKVKVVKSMYKPYEQQITVTDDQTKELNVELIPNFATVTLTTDSESEIWIDGEKRGKGQWTGQLEMGEYKVEVKKDFHRTVSEIVNIGTLGARTIQLKSPIPILTSLEIASTPSYATVLIDGVKVGETPLIKNDVLIGKHQITFQKEGYGSVVKTVELLEGAENSVSVELSNTKEVQITSSPSGAKVSIDGDHKGTTPFNIALTYGEHKLTFSKDKYNTEAETIDVNSGTNTISHYFQTKRKVSITSEPYGASVKIDGAYKGTTPLSVDLGNGKHLISLQRDGYQSKQEYRLVTSNNQQFHFKLQPTKTNKTQNSKPVKSSYKYSVKKTNEFFSPKDCELYLMLGAEAGYSAYGFNYGWEVDATCYRLLFMFAMKSHVMGNYTMCDNDVQRSNQEHHSIQLLRFSNKIGWIFGNNLQITPLIGVVYGPSFLSGRKYVNGELPRWGWAETEGKVLADKDYNAMNRNIIKFSDRKCGMTLGTRLEYRFNFGLGLHVTPEYVFWGEGVTVNAGVTMRFRNL